METVKYRKKRYCWVSVSNSIYRYQNWYWLKCGQYPTLVFKHFTHVPILTSKFLLANFTITLHEEMSYGPAKTHTSNGRMVL